MTSSMSDKVRENRARRAAARQGFTLTKSRRRDPQAHDYGVYWLADASTSGLACSEWGLTLHEVEAFLTYRSPEVDVRVMPDSGDVVFDERNTPILVWERHPITLRRGIAWREGWVLYYVVGSGVENHLIGGELDNLDGAVESAKNMLRRWHAA